MAVNTGPPSSSTMRRWTTLVVVAANIAFVADYSILSESPTITEVVAEYGKMFVPAGFAQAICAAILVAFMLFYFDALWPRRHRIRVYDKLVIPLAMTSVLAPSWIVAFRQEEMGVAAALVAASFALGCHVRTLYVGIPEPAFQLAARSLQPPLRRDDHCVAGRRDAVVECRRTAHGNRRDARPVRNLIPCDRRGSGRLCRAPLQRLRLSGGHRLGRERDVHCAAHI